MLNSVIWTFELTEFSAQQERLKTGMDVSEVLERGLRFAILPLDASLRGTVISLVEAGGNQLWISHSPAGAAPEQKM